MSIHFRYTTLAVDARGAQLIRRTAVARKPKSARKSSNWPVDRDYMAPPSRGELVALDPALLVTSPEDLGAGYAPVVKRQAVR
jgi:hypothetical protein